MLTRVNIYSSSFNHALWCAGRSDEALDAVARQLQCVRPHRSYIFVLTKCLLGSRQTPLRPSLALEMPAIKVQAMEHSRPGLHSVGPLRGAHPPVPEALTFLAATSVEAASAPATPLPEDMLHPAPQGMQGPHRLQGSALIMPSRCALTAHSAQALQCARAAPCGSDACCLSDNVAEATCPGTEIGSSSDDAWGPAFAWRNLQGGQRCRLSLF